MSTPDKVGSSVPGMGTPPSKSASGSATKKKKSKVGAVVPQPKFSGRCPELAGHVYDCSDSRQSDLFTKTTKELAEHVGKTFKFGGDIARAIENRQLPQIGLPIDPGANAGRIEEAIFREEVKQYVSQKSRLRENVKSLYNLILGQCTDVMQAKIEAAEKYETFSTVMDAIELLVTIRDICFNFQSQKYEHQSEHEAMRKFYLTCQDQHSTCTQYLEKFKNAVDVVEHVGGSFPTSERLLYASAEDLEIIRGQADRDQRMEIRRHSRDMYLAVAFVMSADRQRYGKTIQSLESAHTQGQDTWPKTLQLAYNLLVY